MTDDELRIRSAATSALRDAGCKEDAVHLLTDAVAGRLDIDATGTIVAVDGNGVPRWSLFGPLTARDVVMEMKAAADVARCFGL